VKGDRQEEVNMSSKLLRAYEIVMMQFFRGKITREERNARIIALRDTTAAAGLSFEERDALANKAVEQVAEILDDAALGPSGRWQ
jgi:hypothetical protein